MTMLRRLTILAAVLLIATCAFAQVDNYKDIKTPALRSVKMPQPARIQLGNGMVVFLMEDHELPLIRATLRIRGGERDVPAAKAGLAQIYGSSWRTGGTESKTGDELDQLLESRAARVETGGGIDATSMNLDVLKGDFDTVFPIFLDLLQHPAFRQEKVELAKTQANTAISRRNDEQGAIAGREAAKLGYGPDSPYARQTEYASIASITRDDLLAFHKKYVHPNNMILGLVGDFDAKQMEAKIRQAFGSMAKGPQAPKAEEFAPHPAKAGVYFVPKENVTQANIQMVHPATLLRRDPDYPAVAVMNEILSGGFSGRLMLRLRSQQGLTYGVGGGVGADFDHPTLFRAAMSTKSGSTVEAIGSLRKELSGLVSEPVTADELSAAKESILNAYVFTADSRAKIMNQAITLEFYGYPPDYFQKYPDLVRAVTAEDVTRVAKKYVHPDQLALLVVGNEKDFDKPLNTLGSVTPIDITIPEAGGGAAPKSDMKSGGGNAMAAPAPAATASTPEGVALAKKVLDFVGGKAKVDAVQARSLTADATMKTPQGDMQMGVVDLMKYPDTEKVVRSMPMGEMTMVLAPSGSFVITPMGAQDLPSSQSAAMGDEMKMELLSVLKNVDNPKYVFSVNGTQAVGSKTATVLSVNADGATVKWLVDPATGQLLGRATTGRGPMSGENVAEYTEWKTFGGLNLPVAWTVTRNGEKVNETHVSTYEINPAVDANAFVRPGKP